MQLQQQYPNSAPVVLTIDKAKYWNFVVDDITAAQADISIVSDWTTAASEQMKITINTHVLGTVYADVDARNCGVTAGGSTAANGMFDLGTTGSPVVLDRTNMVDYLVHAGTVLDKRSIPETGRWVVLPPEYTNLIKRSELKDASLSGDGVSTLRNGRIGRVDRFEIYQDNNVASVVDGGNTCHHLLFGNKQALTFAMQVVKSETLRVGDTFGDVVRGLTVYGFKVVQPTAIGDLYARPSVLV
jgi:hypothetical protein